MAVLERGPLQGRAQEWNISRKELAELVSATCQSPAHPTCVLRACQHWLPTHPPRPMMHQQLPLRGCGVKLNDGLLTECWWLGRQLLLIDC